MNPNRPRLIPELLSTDQVPRSKFLTGDSRGNFCRVSKLSEGPTDGHLVEYLRIVGLVCDEGDALVVGRAGEKRLRRDGRCSSIAREVDKKGVSNEGRGYGLSAIAGGSA
jgi:hypothetical protein